MRRSGLLSLSALVAVFVIAAGTQAAPAPNSNGEGPARVKSKDDGAKAKLHPKLRQQVESGSTAQIYVFATVQGDPSAAKDLLADANVAESGGAALVLGKIGVQALPKLAGAKGVVAVNPISFEQTGQPLGQPDPDVAKLPTSATKDKALRDLYAQEVPYSRAPQPRASRFEQLKTVALLDAKTHKFAEAWGAGFAGEGVTVGVLDGGTDFGHPDLLNTWQVWSGQTGLRAGWNGWPKAFDPYGTLQWLAAPSQIDQGLSWYTKTTAATCPDWASKSAQSTCPVQFATKTGPSRNFNAPTGTKRHNYQFPAGVTKTGNVRLGSHPDDHLLALFGERPAFLVADSTTAGVYDTVYVDLDNDYRFDDEKPVTKGSPAAYRDMNGDGYTDISGGLVYHISDGTTIAPGGADAFGVAIRLAPGELVAWTGDFDPAIGGHGTLTASNIVGQGVAKGLAPKFDDYIGEYPGVIGGAPKAKLAPYGDIYFSFEFSTQFGYFLSTHPTRGIDVTSNSYGSSDVDNDGYDAASQEADVIHNNTRTTALFSTGNGAPGFGTEAPPSPSSAIAVGASTQFGGTGWDSIADAAQITDNDIIPWSNRGPGATGSPGVDVVADGAYSAGDLTLNAVLNGQLAWETWGGTSRSAPVAAAATALVYQAYRAANGATVPANFHRIAKSIMKSSAQDLGYDTLIQGAGSVDAGEAVRTARAQRPSVSPSEWRAGSYRGTDYPVFTHVLAPGTSDSQTFTVTGTGAFTPSDSHLMRTDSETIEYSSADVSAESPYNFNVPNYLIDLSDRVEEHADADLMVVRLTYPNSQFDPNGDVTQDQLWRILAYNWTDQNGDGNLWTDTGDGTVDFTQLGTSSNIDHNLDVDYSRSEIDKGEYVRMTYLNNASNSLQLFVRNPAERMADGLFFGLQHTARTGAIPKTDFDIQIDYYENVDWPWLSTSAAGNQVTATMNVPADAPYGIYSGAIELQSGGRSIVVPVSTVVAPQADLGDDGKMDGSITFGGSDVAEAQEDSLYNNGSIFGANTWQWRAESGDWRFFYFDVPSEPAEGSLLLVNTTWEGSKPTDIDTLVFGRAENHFQVLGDSVFGAPYILDTVGGSPNRHLGSGRWAFDTATGEAADFVAAPMQEGLHGLALHGVNWNGEKFHVPFEATVGGASVSPSSVVETTADGTGSFDVTFESSVDLPGLAAEAFGLSQPSVTTETARQDDPNDPSSASVKKNITLSHASRLSVTTQLDQDIDLFVVYDANNDGNFTNAEIVASSATGTGNESVELVAPEDGNYQVWAQGWAISGTPSFTLAIDAIQGSDMTVSGLPSGPVTAGTPVTVTVTYSKTGMTAGDWFGELLLGPPSAPTALKVPIKVTKTG